MFKVYILYSAIKDKYYVGQTEDLERRFAEHNLRKNLGIRITNYELRITNYCCSGKSMRFFAIAQNDLVLACFQGRWLGGSEAASKPPTS